MSGKAAASLSENGEKDVHVGLDLDDLLSQIGEFEKCQKILFWLICLPVRISCGFCAVDQHFMADVPSLWCKILELVKFPLETGKPLGIPLRRVVMKITADAPLQRQVVLGERGGFRGVNPNQNWSVEGCLDGWEFDASKVLFSVDLSEAHAVSQYHRQGLILCEKLSKFESLVTSLTARPTELRERSAKS